MNFRQILSLLTATVMIFLVGCSSQLVLPAYENVEYKESLPADTLSIQYLGVGGHILSYKGTQIMTAPSLSNPHFMFSGPFFPLSADEDEIDQYLPDVSNVEMLLVGHGHYDHMLDVPYVMQQHAKKAHIYGSNTVARMMKPAINADRIHAMNDVMSDLDKPGEWMYGISGKVRIMAIKSDHAPHIMGMKLIFGEVSEDLQSLPWHGFGWKEGQTLAYVIDFLEEDKSIAHRIFYQDAASQQPLGLVPELNDEKGVDVAILCPASFDQIDDYPEAIVRNTQAKEYILGHWEDFFANDLAGEQRFLRLTDQEEFVERLEAVLPEGSSWVLPSLFSTMNFAPGGKLLK
jgi:hypothetical protein